eukprot:786612-Amphidinium_carterae.1
MEALWQRTFADSQRARQDRDSAVSWSHSHLSRMKADMQQARQDRDRAEARASESEARLVKMPP